MNKILYLSRHGESEYNILKRIGGNSNITANGEKYAKKIHNYFQNEDLDIYTSKLNRTIQTAKYFSNTLELENLNEINSGIFDGYTYEEIKQKDPEEYNKRKLDKYNYKYPNGESYKELKNRVKPVIDIIKTNTQNALIICHQAVLRVIYSYFMPIDNKDIPYLDVPLNTIFKINISENNVEQVNINIGVL